jgi:hypothetical protein
MLRFYADPEFHRLKFSLKIFRIPVGIAIAAKDPRDPND